ncbi:T9SS type B sorting domain-containing protein [Muriicola sp. Z0-33]|uniref:T9SS type B sorting domain-containing protein n=1 Tax=Muriicola sp. Z0-33 TaxID=2816957 RepID=UPI0022380F4C|nr:T9SS type B sorting domain-containing protein [Muriicola sp. Z0-33]MCW5514680.1 T9SS type B sorting domain-containing protein [Muriicola sp. Z0-33]
MKLTNSKKLLFALAVLFSYIGTAQQYNTFDIRYQNNIKGDLTFIANNIVNRDGGTATTEPEDPYNLTGNSSTYNDWLSQQYIDVDSDPTTFSSSTATFNFAQANCNLIRYAGLYWSATYPSEQAGQALGTNRQNDFNQVKFMVPGGAYVDVIADEVLFDGFTSTDPSVQQNSPYACYADVTALVTALADPTGDYTIANVRSVVGSLSPGGGAAGGWTLVIAYENPTLTGKLITTFDGFARVRSANPTVDINYSGFNTIPAGPVRATIGAAALEGDNRITGDRMRIRAASVGSFTTISDPVNPASNFFNSNITLNGAITTNRNPNSVNTLGYDTDMFSLNNPLNSVIPNNETDATLRFTSSGDQYYPFFNSFNVEIIEPNMVVEKKVEDIAGNDITGAGVNLGQLLDYVLSFQNIGNDDATNYTLRDVLPINVTLDETNMVLPPGVTYTFDALSRTVTFTIPDNLIEIGDPVSQIRMRVQVAENCFDFIDACTDLIQNLAYSTYEGVINDNVITDDPSVSDFDNCGFVTPGATNFLLDDLENCDFSRTVQLCGANVLLDAGDNFDSYIWYKDENEDGLIDAGDTIIDDGDPDNDPSTQEVTQVGMYIVDKIVADPCKGFQEIITVISFGSTQPNPIVQLINDPTNTVEGEVVTCPNDGELLPNIFLCGLNDTEPIQVNIPDALSIEWEQLDEASCGASIADCANTDSACTWNNVGTGINFLAENAGEYRLQVNYQNGCFGTFYFNIFKNPLDPQFNKTDLICTSPGNITVTNMPADYEYQLLDAVSGAILVPYSANNGPSFSIASNGAYSVEMRQVGVVDGCVFHLENIGILTRDFQVDVVTTDATCSGLGEIAISILNVEPQYYYEISQGGTTVDTFGPSTDNNYTFQNLNPGVYDILATTDDGCNYTEQVTILDNSDLFLDARVSQHITCREGNILMDSGGGKTPHTYAIWSYVDEGGVPVISYPTPGDIPPSEFQTSQIFDILDPGDYTFVVVDRNNCFALSNLVTIEFRPAADFAATSVTDVLCFGEATGGIQFNLIDDNGYQLTYYLFDGAGFDEDNYDYANALAANASGNFPNLPAGDYAIVITQRKGSASCDYFEYHTISTPADGITANAVLIQDYTCTQLGIIEAQNVAGGVAPYEYSIDGVNFVSGAGAETFSNLTNGSYTISVRDANGCVFLTNPIVIDPLNEPSDLTFTATQPLCPALISDVTVTVVDGNTPFVFEIIAPAAIAASSTSGNSADFNGLAPDTYTFRVTDDKGCTYDESFTISPVTPIGVVGQLVSNISCFGDTDGEALFTVSGFATSYDYTITGPANFNNNGETSTTIPLTNLAAGTYDITVTDTDTNCTDTASVIIAAPPAALTIAAVETQPTCTDPGSVVITASDGWGSYNYSLTYPDLVTIVNNSTGNFTNLAQSGTYSASVTDGNGCVAVTTFDLNAAIAPVLSITANDLCYDDAVGLTLTATVTSGGDGNFEYRINGGAYDPNNVFAGLGPGTYTIDVVDGNNCTGTDTITIDPELSVTATAVPITACGTDTDVTITAAGGDNNYVYAIVADGVAPIPGDFGVINPIAVTGAGDYDVYVRDHSGGAGFCEVMFDITIVQDAPLAITPTVTPVVCFGDSNGAISLLVTGGAAPYEYSIDNGTNYQTSTDFVNLTAGTYPVRVRDANNCEETASIDITEPAALVAEAAQTLAYTCLQLGEITVGSITPTSGGSGDFQYSLNGGTWSASTPGGIVYPALTDGTYSITVRDANAVSCVLTLPDVIIAPLPVEPTLSTAVTYNCDGSGNVTVLPNDPSYTYSLDAGAPQASNVFNNVAVGNHTITVNYGSDCTVDTTVAINAGNAFDASITNFTNLLCNADASGTITFDVENFDIVNGFEYSVNAGAFSAPQTVSPITVNGLSAGNITIVVRDVLDNSCSVTLMQNLAEPAVLVASASITEPFTCNNAGATITASAVGGTPSYEYQLEDGVGGIIIAYQASTVFTSLAAGDYVVRVRDANACIDPIDTALTVVAPNNPTFTATPTACYSGANDGTIQVDVTSLPGNGGFQFSIDGGPWITPSPVTATSYTFSNLAAGTYTIDVKDQFGCADVQQSITINPQLTANAVLTADLTCLAPAAVTINAAGGSGTYSYEWSNDAGASYFSTNFVGNTFSTNTDGTYIFRVTDTTAPTACTVVTNQVIVSPADTPVITTVTPTHILCNGDSTGALDVIIDTSIGNPPYVIEVIETISTTNYGTQTTGLPAGDYEVTITDDKGCVSVPFPVTINEPNAIAYGINVVPIICNPISGTDPGSITVENLSGGTVEYTYYLTGNNGFSDSYVTTAGGEDHTFTILEFGIYEVDVVDANGCSLRTTNIIASPPNDLDIDVSTATVSCAAGGTAIVTVSSAVGSGNYEFAILETYTVPYSATYQAPDVVGGDTSTFTGLVPGITYTFVVHDLTTNCYYFETAAAPIDSPSNMTVTSLVESNVSCTGANDGNVTFTFDTFDVLATDVTYEIFNAQSNVTTTFTGTTAVNPPAGPVTINNFATLPPGIYYILLAEVGGPFDGCSISSPNFTIDESTNLLSVTAASPTNDNCNPNAGVITALAQFGQAPYEFQYLLNTDPAPTAASPGWTSSTTANVESGDYIVYVKDAYDCIQSDPVTVLLDARPEISIAVVDDCAAEGAFEVLVTLDVPSIAPYQLSVNGGPFQNITFNGSNQYTVSGLSSGLAQTIAVRDLNGCADTDPFNIQPNLQFNASLTALLDCEAGVAANAEITIDVSVGSGSYEYEISGPVNQARVALPSNPFTWNLASAAGAYTVTVYDVSTSVPNCFETIVVDVPAAVTPAFTETHIDISCNGANDGSITLIPTDNGISPLTYTISPVAGVFNAGTNTFENLPPNTYTITATGTNSCTTDIVGIVINEPNPIVVPAPAVVEFGCTAGNNPNNATITINDAAITGGSSTYVIYEFINDQGTVPTGDDVIVQTGPNTVYTETDVAGGTYIINVYDDNGCIGSTTAAILPYDELLTATAAITNPISCTPGTDGEITITVTSTNNDTTRFEYSIDNGAAYQASNVFAGLGIGVHDFLIRHIDTGCIITASETITDPNTFDIVINKIQDVICFGTNTGQVEFSITDAVYVAGFDYQVFEQITNIPMTALLNQANLGPTPVVNLPVGDYYVVITQDNHPFCTQQENFSVAGPPAAITANTDIIPITCLGNDGSIEIIDVLGGWGGYSYYVGTVAPAGPGSYVAGPQFAPLSPGTYEAWVIDSAGCQQMIQNGIVLADPAPITATLQINQENCTNLQGEIEVIGTAGGQGSNYTYQLIKDAVAFGAPQTSTVFSGLGAGSYEVQITDQWSCTVTIGPEVLYEEMNLISTVVKPLECGSTPDAEITITVNGGSGNLDYTVTFPDLVTTVSNATGVFTALDQAGTYTFVITDLNTSSPVCTETIAVDLDAPTPVTFDPHTITDVSCNGLSDGSITVNLAPAAPGVNDNPIYAYNLYDAGGVIITGPQSSPIFSGLPAATYQVEAVSDRNCFLREFVVVNEPTLLTVTAAATTFVCNPDNTVNTSTITATVPVGSGTAPYLYSIDNINFQTSSTFDIVDSGATQNITVYVSDANGCTTTDTVSIEPINVFSVTVTQNVAISCVNPEEVLITVTDDGNPANVYTYELLPLGNPNGALTSTPTNVTATFDLSAVGSYTFRITDTTTGCYVDTAPYTIAPFDLIDVVATATTPVTCFGDSNGALEINVSGYTGAYSYEVFDSSGVTTGISGAGDTATNPFAITGLSGGNYFVSITETLVPLCVEDSNIITIVSPDMPLIATVSEVANVTCTNDQGEILIDPTGGYAPYDIVLTNTTTTTVYNVSGVNSQLFAGLSAGNFTVAITDANGCVINDVINLVQPTPITADITATPTTLVCYGDTNATVTAINVVGGEGSYDYQLNYYDPTGTVIDFTTGEQASPVFDNLGAGIYSITVSDRWNCDVETVQVTISEPTDVASNLIQLTSLSCTNPAELELTATGGTAPYEWSTDGIVYSPMAGGNTHVFTVPAGVYQYYVRDAFGCEATISNQVSVDAIVPLNIVIDDSAAIINCTGEATATIIADAFGGLGNYSYELFTDAALTNLIGGPQPDGEFNNLIAGSYYVRVTSMDCVEVSPEIIITEPVPLQIDRQEFTDVTCAGQADGTITVEVSGGTGTILYAITPNLNQFDTENVFTELDPGVYDVIAQDENGCFIPFQFTIIEPTPVDVTFTALPEVCLGSADGSADLVITGGTAPYRTAFNSNADADFVLGQTSFVGLAAGTYAIFVRDAQDCETNVIVTIDPGVNLNATVEPMYECTGDTPENFIVLTLEDPSVSGDVMYALDSTDPADMQLSPDFRNMTPGTHFIGISHANGCIQQTLDFVIDSFEPVTLTLEQNNINEITAIGAGGLAPYTYYFEDIDNGSDPIYYINRTDTYTVRVVDANGCEATADIFMEFIDIEIPNFFTPDGDGQNDLWMPRNTEIFPEILIKIFDRYGRVVAHVSGGEAGWDGRYKGSELPTGDYWYVIKLKADFDDREFVGHFTLYR